MRYFIILCVLVSCGYDTPLVEPDGCGPNPEIERVEIKKLCIDSLRCVKEGEVKFSNYMCFCDNICLCFFSIVEGCRNISEDTCLIRSSLLIVSEDFCLSSGKTQFLEDLHIKVEEINAE